MEESPGQSKKAIIGLVVVVLLLVAATAVLAAGGNGNKSNTTNVATNSSTPSSNTSSNSSSSASNFKDGTYSASANYDTPGGTQSIDVKLTIASNAVSDVSISQNATGREDEAYQSDFASQYKSEVVGKKLSDISVFRIAGASLTTGGFNTALQQIESQAAA